MASSDYNPYDHPSSVPAYVYAHPPAQAYACSYGYGYDPGYNIRPSSAQGHGHGSAPSYGQGLPQPPPAPLPKQSYFLPGYGLSRHVIMRRIPFFVGHNYTIRPFTYNHREGYLLTHDGAPLTKNQIDDLKEDSLQFEQREAEKMRVRSASLSSEELYINRPIPVQQRHSYLHSVDEYVPS